MANHHKETGPLPQSIRYQGAAPAPMVRGSRAKFRFWYDNIIDWMLVNPQGTIKECAEALGRKPDTLYAITGSDLFKARLADRRADYNVRLADSLAAASSGVALSALSVIQDRISNNPEKIPTGLLSDIADKALNRLGYGVAPVATSGVTITNQILVSPTALREAQERMRQVQQMNAQDITPVTKEASLDYPIPTLSISSK